MAGGLDDIELPIIDGHIDDCNDKAMLLSVFDKCFDVLVVRTSNSIVVSISIQFTVVKRSIESHLHINYEVGFNLFDKACFDKEMCINQKSGTTKSNS